MFPVASARDATATNRCTADSDTVVSHTIEAAFRTDTTLKDSYRSQRHFRAKKHSCSLSSPRTIVRKLLAVYLKLISDVLDFTVLGRLTVLHLASAAAANVASSCSCACSFCRHSAVGWGSSSTIRSIGSVPS